MAQSAEEPPDRGAARCRARTTAAGTLTELILHVAKVIENLPGRSVSFYWPFRGEPDLRPFMQTLWARGQSCSLPVVVEKNAPLAFRLWQPGCKLVPGVWNIPVPADGAEVEPEIVIAPVVGFDSACYRLGYGGGFFDRTLAKLSTRPVVIGVGYARAALASIYPLPHDVPMDVVVTERGIARSNVAGVEQAQDAGRSRAPAAL